MKSEEQNSQRDFAWNDDICKELVQHSINSHTAAVGTFMYEQYFENQTLIKKNCRLEFGFCAPVKNFGFVLKASVMAYHCKQWLTNVAQTWKL